MSNTTRLGNTDIVNIAKQRFDKQQRSKLPSIIVNLPSSGLIYPKDHVLASGQIEMRYMTAYDEDILTNTSYMRGGVIFDKLLESIVMTDVNVTEIPDIDKDALIINARIISYGAEYPVTVTNSSTSTEYERTVNLSKIQPKPFTLIPDDNGEFTYDVKDIQIKFSYNNPPTETNGVTDFLKNYIREINGDRSDARIAEFIRYEFLALDSRNFRKHVVDNAPGLDYSYEFEGENGSTFIAPFRVGLDLFWF